MKHRTVFLLMLLFVLGLLGCTEEAPETLPSSVQKSPRPTPEIPQGILISNMSDCVAEIDVVNECAIFYSKQVFEDQPATWRGEICGKTLVGTYKYSQLRRGVGEYMHKYLTDNGDTIYVDDEGNALIYTGGDVYSGGNKPEEQYIKVAKEFAIETWNLNPSDYMIECRETIGSNREVIFTKMVQGIPTYDTVRVVLDSIALVHAFNKGQLGEIEPSEVPELDFEAIEEAQIARLDSLTEKARKVYDEVHYNDYYCELSEFEEGKYLLICQWTIDCVKYCDGYNEVPSQLVQFVINLEDYYKK